MQEVFGPITPFVILYVLMLVVEWIKRTAKLSGVQVQLIAFLAAEVVIVAYETASTWPNITPMSVFSSFFYGVIGWLVIIGMYEATIKNIKVGTSAAGE